MVNPNFQFRFPFVAILGQEDMKLALLLNVIDPKIGGVLLTGQQGTGKSTAVRSLIDILPEISVNEGCQFQCDIGGDPGTSDKHNPSEISENSKNSENLCEYCQNSEISHSRIKKPINLVNLPLGSTEEMIIGTLDIQKIIKEGKRAIQPGLLAKAHRGILYIDEINLLQDHLVDILLDVAASGENIIEREGISLSHPSSFVLIGSMNPEEGELRPQISDRLGLEVVIKTPTNPTIRAQITKRVIEYHDNPQSFITQFASQNEELRERLIVAKELLPKIAVPDYIFDLTARLILKIGLYSQRADITFIRCARAHAAFSGRTTIEREDLEKSINLSFQHRVKRTNHDIPRETLHQIFNEIYSDFKQAIENN
ncbi:MAG: ATP-binding protein [Promethearchaeota archaeon]